MRRTFKVALFAVSLAFVSSIAAQQRPIPVGPVSSDTYRTTYLRLGGGNDDGLLYEPVKPGPNAHIALVTAHPNGDAFNAIQTTEMAKRGYTVLAVVHRGDTSDLTVLAQPLSKAVEYLRTIKGVEHVVIMGHSGGGELVTFYQNLAEHGPSACNGPEKIFPCNGKGLSGLGKPDAIVILDSTLGAFHQMSAVDPAVDGDKRITSLDMFAAANGYDPKQHQATYSAEFAKRFYAAQSARNNAIIDSALARLKAIEAGKGEFTDDEPLLIRGMGENAGGTRLYQPDPAFAAHTKKPHTLLKADGTTPVMIVPSVRGPVGQQFAEQLNALSVMSQDTTVRKFLVHSAIRTTADFAITADGITGVDWKSAITSAPGNAEGITVPALIVSNTCHYLMMQDEILYDHLASKDKTLVYNEGSTHMFTPCKPEYGDTTKRAFDYVNGWLNKPGRF
jgi:pimeloyl-ACP methyl ester carboxylesterase